MMTNCILLLADGCVILKTSGADYKNDIMIYFERYFYGAVKVRIEYVFFQSVTGFFRITIGCVCVYLLNSGQEKIYRLSVKNDRSLGKMLPFVRKAEYKLEQEGEDNYLCSRHIKILSYEKVKKNQIKSAKSS